MIRALNALLKHADVALVRASRLGFQYEVVAPDAWVPALPDAADAALLQPDNKRLLELREQYAALADHPARVASLWSAKFSSAVDLTTFRGHNAYLWQNAMTPARRMSFLLAGYYAHSVDALGLLERMTEDGAFGAYTFRFMERFTGSKDLVDSVSEINFLERHLGLSRRSAFSVLDIGAGYGRLLHRLAQAFPHSMRGLATDAVPESTFLSEFYLRHRGVADQVQVVALSEAESRLSGQAIDLVTNVHSFSECTLGAIEWWLDRVVDSGARHLFIIPNAYHNGGLQLLSREEDGRFLDFLPAITRRGFKLLVREPKYRDTSLHAFGINTYYHLFERA